VSFFFPFFPLSATISDKQMTSRMTSTFAGTRPAHYRHNWLKSTTPNSRKKPYLTSSLTSKMTSTYGSILKVKMTVQEISQSPFNKTLLFPILPVSSLFPKANRMIGFKLIRTTGMACSLGYISFTHKTPII
jgi:hypothetical protein